MHTKQVNELSNHCDIIVDELVPLHIVQNNNFPHSETSQIITGSTFIFRRDFFHCKFICD